MYYKLGRQWVQQSQPVLSSGVPFETSRVMLPDDTNPMGNVHGGTILKLIEQAGHIVATRHCNQSRNDKESTSSLSSSMTSVLARVEHMDFHNPIYVGEVAQVSTIISLNTSKFS